MKTEQIIWLKSIGIVEDSPVFNSIDYCDIDKQRIIFKDGMTRQVTEVWSRVMGYHRPTCTWNDGKKSEFNDRVYFNQDI